MQKKEQQDFKSLDRSLRLQKIIDTATELFHKKGYRSTTLDDVSRKLGLTKAALYHYVSSKEKLLSIIYIQALENIFKNLDKISGRDLPPQDKLRLIIRNHVKSIIIDYLSLFSVFFSEENQLPENDFKKIQEEKRKYTRIVEKIIEDGISQGIFRESDTKLQAYGIIGMCNWVYKWYRPDHSPYSPEQIADHFVELLEIGYVSHRDTSEAAGEKPRKWAKVGSELGTKVHLLEELKNQCMRVIELIDELEA
ncbi:MAG: TetR/AcrR family transcriptional regulator [Desulfobacteraceae bacterium]|jgi:AcrR family transcriptional regulator